MSGIEVASGELVKDLASHASGSNSAVMAGYAFDIGATVEVLICSEVVGKYWSLTGSVEEKRTRPVFTRDYPNGTLVDTGKIQTDFLVRFFGPRFDAAVKVDKEIATGLYMPDRCLIPA